MPIRPENKARYPKNWKFIRKCIQFRAGDKCELCGVKNYSKGVRDVDGIFHHDDTMQFEILTNELGLKPIKIVCTVMHLDHQPENNDPDNLKFGCQRCHNRYDQPHRIANRKKNKSLTPQSGD